MKIMRSFYISCDTFGGFKREIDINLCNSTQDIIDRMLCLLEQSLRRDDLYQLILKLQTTKHLYHIHDFQFGTILLTEQEYYICNHGCSS